MGEKFSVNPLAGTGFMTVSIAASPGLSGFDIEINLVLGRPVRTQMCHPGHQMPSHRGLRRGQGLHAGLEDYGGRIQRGRNIVSFVCSK